MGEIHFFEEDISFQLSKKDRIIGWLSSISQSENHQIDEINYIFCSDEYLLQINQQYLNHDYYTDIITFDNSDSQNTLYADIFISIDRVRDNADQLDIPFKKELHRVLVHGLLHLLGYTDKTNDDKILMRQKEDTCLSLLK